MPNLFKNRLTVTGEQQAVKNLFAAISSIDETGERLLIDFNKIVPLPPCKDDQFWRLQYWDSIWNAECQVQKEECGPIIFISAAFSPEKVMLALSAQHPDTLIRVDFAIECMGCFIGYYVCKNGERIQMYTAENESEEAFRMWCDLWPEEKDKYQLVDGQYMHVNI